MTAEIEGSKIIDWSLDVGNQTLRWREPARTVPWMYGMPITLSLRLAKDSPLAATSDPQQAAMDTDGQTVTYRFDDPWAFLTFMQRHRDAENAPRQDGRSQLLKFEFPLRPQALTDVAAMPAGGKARVYLRVMVMPVGKKAPLFYPAVFPTRAPEWNLP